MFTYAESLRVISRGGLTSLDRATIDAVRAGARPGHPLAPREPGDYLAHVTDADVIITGGEAGRRAAVLFTRTQHFPGIRSVTASSRSMRNRYGLHAPGGYRGG